VKNTGPNGPDSKPDDSGKSPDSGQTVLTLQTAARYLNLTPDALRKRIQRGKVDAYKEGGQWFVRVDNTDRPKRKTAGQRTDSPTAELYERLLAVTEEATRYKTLAEVSESTRRESEEHYKAQIAELQAHIDELEQRRRPWWRRGKRDERRSP